MKSENRGFTLVELLIVISIIGVLTGVSVAILNPVKQFQRARDTQRKADIAKIQQALELYRSDNNGYPGSLPGCNTPLKGTGPTVDIVYIRSIPCDPKNTSTAYSYTPVGVTSYTITACLENLSDPLGGAACGSNGKLYTQTNP